LCGNRVGYVKTLYMTQEFIFDWVDGQPIVCEGQETFNEVFKVLKDRNQEHLLPEGERVIGKVTRPFENQNNFNVEMSVCVVVDTEKDGEDDVWVEYFLSYSNKNFFWTMLLENKSTNEFVNQSHGRDLC